MRWEWVVGVLLLVGCASEAHSVAPPATPKYAIPSMRWLPPGENIVYAYKTEDLVEKTTGVLTFRLQHPAGDTIELVTPQRSEMLRYQEYGIFRERTGALLLKIPPELGAQWPAGPGVRAKILQVNQRVTVEAGAFEGCLKVQEERHAPISGTVTTTFCPDVGIVLIETAAEEPLVMERVELRSFGRAVDLFAQP